MLSPRVSGFSYGSDISNRTGFASVTVFIKRSWAASHWLSFTPSFSSSSVLWYSRFLRNYRIPVTTRYMVTVVLLSIFNAQNTPCFIFALGDFVTRGPTLDAELRSVNATLILARHVPHGPALVASERPINFSNGAVH